MIVNVFDWRANLKMASNKISSKVSAVCFAEDGSYFVTVGNRHVKYWYLEGGRKVSGECGIKTRKSANVSPSFYSTKIPFL